MDGLHRTSVRPKKDETVESFSEQVQGRYMSATTWQQRQSEEKKDGDEAGETAAAKETEEISKEDVEIRRLIEERRSTPKEEKQRLKKGANAIKNVSETKKKNENTARHPKNT